MRKRVSVWGHEVLEGADRPFTIAEVERVPAADSRGGMGTDQVLTLVCNQTILSVRVIDDRRAGLSSNHTFTVGERILVRGLSWNAREATLPRRAIVRA